MKHRSSLAVVFALLSTLSLQQSNLHAQGTAFTYQGRLNNSGTPANGLYDLRFKLATDPLANNYVGGDSFATNTPVTNGLFLATIDFGSGIFAGSNYWLEVDVRTNNPANTLAYTTLTPLQAVTPTPYAIMANSASNLLGALPASQLSGAFPSQLSGTIPLAQLPGAVVTNNAANVMLGSVTLVGNLVLPMPATVYAGVYPLLHFDYNNNFFAGDAGRQTTTGQGNTAIGDAAFYANLSGSDNVVVGNGGLNVCTNDSELVAMGYQALENDNAAGQGSLSGYGENTAIGYQSLQLNTIGYDNTAIGYEVLLHNTSGIENTANGTYALYDNTSGGENTANGGFALYDNTSGSFNTAIGAGGLEQNTSGDYNTAIGANTLVFNTVGYDNTAIGMDSLYYNTNNDNTAIGYEALLYNMSGTENTAIGSQALYDNTSGSYNVAEGYDALYRNTNGSDNTANGIFALCYNTSGTHNTADGEGALFLNTTGNYNTAIGFNALPNSAGNNNISMGYLAGQNLTTGNNNIYIGSPGTNLDSGIIRIGTPGIQTKTYLIGTVYANNVQLTSDRNAKENFKVISARDVLAKVASLPVTEWNYKDTKAEQHIGPMAQDFQAAFQLSADDKHIAVVDEGGVALAAIQGLNQKLEEQNAENKELKQQLVELKRLVQSLAEKK